MTSEFWTKKGGRVYTSGESSLPPELMPEPQENKKDDGASRARAKELLRQRKSQTEGGGSGGNKKAKIKVKKREKSSSSADKDKKESSSEGLHRTELEEVEEEENAVEVPPIPPPNSPPTELITLIVIQPNLERLKMTNVDPAKTSIGMIRDFLFENYYKGTVVPRPDQRQLLYGNQPIFDSLEGDRDADDAKTLADHGLTVGNTVIELSKMHVNVLAPSDRRSMMINNVDPMNDVIFDMKRLAYSDGYPIERLRLLHKEANNRVIDESQNQATFFDCGVKHNHTLILEWPKVVIKIKLPISSGVGAVAEEGRRLVQDPGTGRYFVLVDFRTRIQLDKVQGIQDFIWHQTGIPQKRQTLFSNPKEEVSSKKETGSKPPKTRHLKDGRKVIADYSIEENDVIELEPMSVKVNLVGPGEETKQMTLDYVFPNDTVQFIKDQIQDGRGEADGIPAVPSTNQSLRKVKDGKELQWDQKSLHEEGIQHLDELVMEKTKITIKVKLPLTGRIIEIGVNPKLDDIETIKDQLADKTGLQKEFLPPLRYKDELMDGEKKLIEYNMVDNDVIDMEPMKLNVDVGGGGDTICIDNIDPFNDTIEDIKERLGPDDLDVLPVDRQRLLFMDVDLDEGDGADKDCEGKKRPSPSSRKLFECNIKHLDTVDLEKSKIDIKIKQPNGAVLELENVNPRKDTVETIEEFLSDKYYKGKDKDGTIPDDQLRPLKFEGKNLTRKDNGKSLRDYGIMDDGKVIEMEPMTVHVIVGAPDNEFGGDSSKMKTLENVDPMNDKILDIKGLGATDNTTVDMLILRHKESNMAEIEGRDGKESFYDNGIKEGDTLVVQRKPMTIRVRLPMGSTIKEMDDEDGVEVIDASEDGAPMLSIKLDTDTDDFDAIRKRIFDYTGVPIDSQKLNRIFGADDEGDDEDPSRKQRLDAAGDTKLSSPSLKLLSDCTIELEPMTINIKTSRGAIIPINVLPSDTIEDVKKKLAKDKMVGIPFNKQRLVMEDGTEIGGNEDNENSKGSDKSTLKMLGVEDGDTLSVEKSKITLKVKMPNGLGDLEVLVDPRNDDVDRIRQLIFDATGLPKEFQQRLYFEDGLMDDGYQGDNSGGDDGGDGTEKITKLDSFNLKEFDCITLDSTRVFIMRMPEKIQVLIEDIDLMNNILQDLKKRVAAKTQLPTFKQRLLNSETNEEYVGNKDSTETLHDYGIKDGDVINLEKTKINLRIILPNLDELELSVDCRKDDLQMVRDYIFKKYYKKREVPKKDMRSMLRGASQVLDNEPGEKKLIEFGINKDDDHVKLKPCYITIKTPRKDIFCPNADPFHDALKDIIKLIESLNIPVDGLRIEFKGKIMTDYQSALYDLGISDDSTLTFVK